MKAITLFLACVALAALTALAADIELKPVKSSLLDKVGYDPESKVLSVQMNNSSDMYLYEGVPMSLYDDFLAADSKGAFYVKNIKGKFETSRK